MNLPNRSMTITCQAQTTVVGQMLTESFGSLPNGISVWWFMFRQHWHEGTEVLI